MTMEKKLLEDMIRKIEAIRLTEMHSVSSNPVSLEKEEDLGSYRKAHNHRVYELYINGVLWQKQNEGPVKFRSIESAEAAANKIRSKGKKVIIKPINEEK